MPNKVKVKANGPQLVGGGWKADGEEFSVYEHQARALQQDGRVHPVVNRFTPEEQAVGADQVGKRPDQRNDLTPWPGDTLDPAAKEFNGEPVNADRDDAKVAVRRDAIFEEEAKASKSSKSGK